MKVPETVYVVPSAKGKTKNPSARNSGPTVYHCKRNCPHIKNRRVLERSFEGQRRSRRSACSHCCPEEFEDTEMAQYECPGCGTTKVVPADQPFVPCPTLDCLLEDRKMVPIDQ